jgi:hypothetical protein
VTWHLGFVHPVMMMMMMMMMMIVMVVAIMMITTVYEDSQCVNWFCHLTTLRSEDFQYFSTLIALPVPTQEI